MFSGIFIDRPRLAVVISLVITIAGLVAMLGLPVAQFPNIVPPQVSVTASYAGASAEVTCDGRNGLIVPLGSEAIAEALTHLLADPALLATMQGESRKVFLERFRIDQFEQALRAMLIEVAARPLPQSRAVPAA